MQRQQPKGGKQMLRITEEKTSEQAITMRLEGRLVGAWVPLLQASCEQHAATQGRLTLDLAEVSFADQAGAALLARLQQEHVKLSHCSPFLWEQIKQVRLSGTAPPTAD
jgi:anti-anti-sigma regulatory factor